MTFKLRTSEPEIDEEENESNVISNDQQGTFKLRQEEPKEKEIPKKHFDVPETSPEDLKKMSVSERLGHSMMMEASRKERQAIGTAKGLAKGASAGFSELIPGMEEQEGEYGQGFGEFVGAAAPIGLTFKAISYPFKALQGLMNFGKVGKAVTNIASQVATGLTYGTEKQLAEVAKGKEFSPSEVAKEGAMFGGFGVLLEAAPVAMNWARSLNSKQRSDLFVKNLLPEDLSPSQYKFYESEVIPELQKVAEGEYKEALTSAIQESNTKYQQELSNVKARHEEELFDMQQNRQISPDEYAIKQKEYQENVKKAQQEHQSEIQKIEKSNQEAEKAFEQQKKDYDLLKARQRAVQEAIRPKTQISEVNNEGRVIKQLETGPYMTAQPLNVNPSLENRIGNIISPNRITNTTNAGRANIEAVRANDAIDYQRVREAYDLSESLNSGVEIIQPNLVQDLRATAENIRSIPDPSPPQKQLLSTIEKILEQTQTVNENGNLTGFQPINNRVLQEQAKSLRYFMDFNFEHGNSRGIFSPTVRHLEEAIEMGASFTMNEAAIEANQNARGLYSEWANNYDNPYIRPYRDTRNFDYSKTFTGSLNPDEFNQLNNILSRSNAGQQLAGSTRRALVDKYLAKFIENPKKINPAEFEKTLSELSAVLNPQEIQQIRQQFNQAGKTPVVIGKKVPQEQFKEPEAPKLEKKPSLKLPKSEVPQISKVNIPTKKEIRPTSEMKIASKKMDITPEKAMSMTNTRTGIKQLRNELNKTPDGKKIFDKIGKDKIKEILYEGNVKRTFKGKDLEKILNKTENFEIFSEILGEKETFKLLNAAKEIGDSAATGEKLQKIIKDPKFTALLIHFAII